MQNSHLINLIAQKIYEIDAICRDEFKKGHIVSERDYISIFLNFVRYPLGPFKKCSFVHSQTLSSKNEQKYGCDGIIIFKIKDLYYIGMFEAKIIKPRWDSLVETGTSKISRFQRQLDKQKTITPPQITVWEMFLNKDITCSLLDPEGSTCVKANIAFSHTITTATWRKPDLLKILEDSYSTNANKPINIEQIINEIFLSTNGIGYNPEGIEFYKDNPNTKLPLIKGEIYDPYIEKIETFMKDCNIYSYTHIDIDEFLKKDTNYPRS